METDPPLPPNEPAEPALPPADELLARALRTHDMTGAAGSWTPPDPEEMNRLLPQYEIEELLGYGGMGAVYKGRQPSLDRAVAVKLLPAEIAANAEFVDRFRREARMLARLQHPGIVAVHDSGQTDEGHLFFVMEYVDGTDLHRLIQGGALTPAQALGLTVQICEALQFAHEQGVIHRDIKPANILITREGRVKLADFGLARPLQEEVAMVTKTSMVMGTPDYMAPEQRQGRADHRADIYALGVMLYEMLAGQRPQGAFTPPSKRVRVDVRLDEVVLRALQEAPERRYQGVDEMRTDVERIRTTPVAPAPQAVRAVKAVKKTRSKAWLAWIGGVLVVLAGVAALLPKGRHAERHSAPPLDSFARDLCFIEDDWAKGIPLLAVKGGHFQEAAAAEARDTSGAAAADSARQWIAAASRVEAPDRWHCYRHARALFRRALGSPALLKDAAEWNRLRAEMQALPTLKAKVRMSGTSYFREEIKVRRSSVTWFTYEAGPGQVELSGGKSLPPFSLSGGGTKSRVFSGEEMRRLLPDGLDFTTAKIGGAHFSGKTGRAAEVLSFHVLPNGSGIDFKFGEVNAAKVRYPGTFNFDATIVFGEDGASVPTPMPVLAAATPRPVASPAPASSPFPVVHTPPGTTPATVLFAAPPPPRAAPTPAAVLASAQPQSARPATPAPATPSPKLSPATTPPATMAPAARPSFFGVPIAGDDTPSTAIPPPAMPATPTATPAALPLPATTIATRTFSTTTPTVPSATQARGLPPIGVPRDAKPFNGKWYRVYTDRLAWKSARDRCALLGGRLAVIHDRPTNAFVLGLADGRLLWLGASDERAQGEWKWVDAKPMSFTAWIKGEPNVARTTAYVSTARGGWYDEDEKEQRGFICEWRGR